MAHSNQRLQRHVMSRRSSAFRLESIEKACLDAWWSSAEDDADMKAFHTIATPVTVYALAQASKAAFSDQDLQDLGRLLDELMNYIKLEGEDAEAAKDTDRDNLILRAREMRSRLGI